VAVLPAVLVLLMAIHFWRIRKDGGLSRPKRRPRQRPIPGVVKLKKVYGLQGLRARTVHQTGQRARRFGL
jgi:hypothetical protein